MSTFQQGDIVRVWVDDELPEPDPNLPDQGWDAIVVGVDIDGPVIDEPQIEVAWLERFITHSDPRNKPIRETWDERTALVTPEYDAHIRLLKRATYTDAAASVG